MARAPIVELLLERAASHPRDPFLLFEERVVTWGELAESSLRTANGLVELGVTPLDRVAVMMDNSPEYLSTYFGVLAAGAGTVPLNTAQRGPALKHILRDSGVRVAVVERHLREAVQAAAPDELRIVARGEESYDRLMNAPDTVPEMGEGESSGLGILYTSGTTGPPKGVVATGYDLSHVHDLLGRLNVKPGEVVYTALPLFHGNALILSAMGAVWNRWTLALAPRFSASRFWDDVRRYNAVETNALGAMIPILLKQPQRVDDADNPMRTVLSAACPAWGWEEFEERFGVRLIEFFGMVDYPGYLINDEGMRGKMGRPTGATEFAVFDDADQPVPPGTVGELVMRHPGGRLTHYHNNPEATEVAFRGGWFHTGDLAVVDGAGLYTYSGRKKESMRRRGENVSAWEIETTVSTHPAVRECAAHAVASELGEDDIKLVVVLQPGAELHESEIVRYCEGRMAHFAIPSYVELRTELPKTGTHRVLYEQLKSEGITPETWRRPELARGARR
jgi:crotonobetaine/carnitine-CoA ligase